MKRFRSCCLAVTIAVIDTGIDPSHPSLKSALWKNPNEIQNGKDDDGNGYIDDIHGWDFVKNQGILSDTHGHGTHIAGIIHRLNPDAKLMILKFYDESSPPEQTITLTAKAIRYAVKMGVPIINYSGGGPSANGEELAALKEAAKNNVMVVAAAGNDSSNSDHRPYFPADYPLSNILSIAAHDLKGRLIPSSNFGKTSVDMAAPGDQISSTLPDGKFGKMTGTSQATAHVTGVASLVWEKFPWARSPDQLSAQLQATGTFTQRHLGQTASAHILNEKGALSTIASGISSDFQYFYDGNEILLEEDSLTQREPSSSTSNWELAERLTTRLNSTGWNSRYKLHRPAKD